MKLPLLPTGASSLPWQPPHGAGPPPAPHPGAAAPQRALPAGAGRPQQCRIAPAGSTKQHSRCVRHGQHVGICFGVLGCCRRVSARLARSTCGVRLPSRQVGIQASLKVASHSRSATLHCLCAIECWGDGPVLRLACQPSQPQAQPQPRPNPPPTSSTSAYLSRSSSACIFLRTRRAGQGRAGRG